MPTAVIVAQLLLQYGPEIAQEFASIFSGGVDPTKAQWDALFAKVRTYDQIVAPLNSATAVSTPLTKTT